MILTTKINRQDYIKWHFRQSYEGFWIRLMTFLGVVWATVSILYYASLINLDEPPLVQIGLAISMLIIVPTLTYLSAKQNFQSNKKIQETISYEFDEHLIKIVGETFKSEFETDTIYKTKEIKHWIMIYQSNKIVNLIPKKNISKNEMSELKQILKLK
ncbi:YcxB family protein [Flavobacterium sp. MAH-1]|uniref:YcxB family protein n=1 Tax=Flavobacterium agri TaxID=2743471 RepID=A0A7Y8Y0W1_9FLAO|nr:YcxB family protein [Flavobacterium agri]NUY80531.1 YcxB family protein [Flavobacterium agri]NYA70556.1 YcxB family protein [Flavobacterium agri]